MKHYPKEQVTDKEADRIIESITPQTRDKLIKFLKINNIETKIQHKNLIYEHKMLKHLNHKKYFSNGNKLKNKFKLIIMYSFFYFLESILIFYKIFK